MNMTNKYTVVIVSDEDKAGFTVHYVHGKDHGEAEEAAMNERVSKTYRKEPEFPHVITMLTWVEVISSR